MTRVRLGVMRDEVCESDKDLTRTLYVEPGTTIDEVHNMLVDSNWFPEGFVWVNNVNKLINTLGELSQGVGSAVICYSYNLEV